jgi:hypothetical protein
MICGVAGQSAVSRVIEHKRRFKVKKLFIGTAIAFLMIFTAGFASAAPTPVYTATECSESGTLYFVALDGTTITEVEEVQLTLNQVPPSAGQPGNFWTGTLTIPATAGLPAGITTTYYVSAIKAPDMSDDPHLFRDIAGTDSTTTILLEAEGRTNNFAKNPSVGRNHYGFFIHGKIYDSGTFVGTFHGPLFQTTP